MRISDQDQNGRSDGLHFDYIFHGLYTNTILLTSAEKCLFLWINSVRLHIQMHTLVCGRNKAATLQ